MSLSPSLRLNLHKIESSVTPILAQLQQKNYSKGQSYNFAYIKVMAQLHLW